MIINITAQWQFVAATAKHTNQNVSWRNAPVDKNQRHSSSHTKDTVKVNRSNRFISIDSGDKTHNKQRTTLIFVCINKRKTNDLMTIKRHFDSTVCHAVSSIQPIYIHFARFFFIYVDSEIMFETNNDIKKSVLKMSNEFMSWKFHSMWKQKNKFNLCAKTFTFTVQQ